MKSVYAVASVVPECLTSLTAGKEYAVMHDTGLELAVVDDNDRLVFDFWDGRFSRVKWQRIERDESAKVLVDAEDLHNAIGSIYALSASQDDSEKFEYLVAIADRLKSSLNEVKS